MPHLKTIWVKYDRDFPLPHLGAGNKVNLACTVEASIDESENSAEAADALWEFARSCVKKEFDRLPKPAQQARKPDPANNADASLMT